MIPLLLPALIAAAPAGVATMKWDRRVLIVAAPSATDPQLIEQQRLLANWRTEAAARDLTIVTVIGDRVDGSTDRAATLRRTYRLPAANFSAILIGKDGGVKRRDGHPLSPATLADTIDSMPMRRAGQR